MRRLWRNQSGSSAMELLGIFPLMLMAALAGWQILLAAACVTSAENAARAASRASSESTGWNALPSWMHEGSSVNLSGETATVVVRVPIVFPGLTHDSIKVTRSAVMPAGF
jgi:hypothetical protein